MYSPISFKVLEGEDQGVDLVTDLLNSLQEVEGEDAAHKLLLRGSLN